MLKPFLIITFSGLLSFVSMGQDIHQTLELAENHLRRHEFQVAGKYYKRAAFFGNDSVQKRVFPLLGELYLYQEDYAQSRFYYNLAANTAPNDSLFNEYIFAQALSSLLLNETNQALQIVYSYIDDGSVHFNQRYHFYLGLIFIEQKNLETSLENFLLAARSEAQRNEIKGLYEKYNFTRPSPKTARILSIILPGMGQAYAGNYTSAFNSFFLNMGLITLMAVTSYNLSVADGVFSVGPWFYRYYEGGYKNAERVAQNRQTWKKNQLKDGIVRVFSQ